MSIITTDFETFFRSKANTGTPGEKYSLKNSSYEGYLFDNRFKCHGFSYQIDHGEKIWVDENDIAQVLRELFYPGNKHTLLAHNVYFEGAILKWIYGLEAHRYYCTMSMSRAVWPQESASLEKLSRRCYPQDSSFWKNKEDLQYSDGIYHLNEEQRYITAEYCKQDVHSTFHAFRKMWNMGFPRSELDVIDITVRMFIDRRIQADRELLTLHLHTELEIRERLIENSGLPEETLSSNEKFHDWMQLEHGLRLEEVPNPTPKNPDNTKIPLAQDDIEFIEIMDTHPELQHVWDARAAVMSRIEITRSQRFLDHSRIHQFNPEGMLASFLTYYGAHTGRWSGGNLTNHQNLGRKSKIRPSLRARKGQKMIIRDQSNIEGRMNAWFCGQWDKCEFIANGGDLYNRLGAEIYGRPIDRKSAKDEAEGFVSKMAELGLGYNLGWYNFRIQLATSYMRTLLSEKEAEHVVTTWRSTNPMITSMWRQLQDVIIRMSDPHCEPFYIGTNDCIRVEYCRMVLPNGLALCYPGLRKIDHPHAYNEFEYWNGKFWTKIYGGKALENCIQALSRISMSDAMVLLQRRWEQEGIEAYIVLTVHDEIVSVCDEHLTERVSEEMRIEMAKTPLWADERLCLASEGKISDHYIKG